MKVPTPPITAADIATGSQEGFRETLESIVIALILAFVFRAFIVEAFVIPTGSMAPTLYGAHGTILCEDCGVEFAYGLMAPDETRRIVPVRYSSTAVCPNCNHLNTHLEANDKRRNPENGDRILVFKWPLYLGGRLIGPDRWDVVVFKDPADGDTNFIKRLVGLPEEVLMIADGDVYSVATSELSDKALAELEALRHEKYLLRSGQRSGRLRAVSSDVLAELDSKMVIRRKSRTARQALAFRVYDHDYAPRTRDRNQPTWSARLGDDSGWKTPGHRLTFEDRGRRSDYVQLEGKEIRATCRYNIHSRPAPPVSDLRVSFVLTPADARSTVQIRLTKAGKTLWATVRADGLVTLAVSDDPPTERTPPIASTRLPPLTPGKPVEVSFENIDYSLAIHVGGDEVLTSSDDRSSPAYYGPDLAALRRGRSGGLCHPRIYGAAGAFSLDHLLVERDEHYYLDASARALNLPWAPRGGWAGMNTPILLRKDEYFMLGDNTAASKDSRLWDQVGPHLTDRGEGFQLGTVPADQLIGKAFFVYWPSGQPLSWLPIPRLNEIGIIPDVGRMRWIR
ncbi:MAG: S26 family signal peptidase [Phycisphaerae bacterium]